MLAPPHFLLLATPRSGSTAACLFLERYYQQSSVRDVKCLFEYFLVDDLNLYHEVGHRERVAVPASQREKSAFYYFNYPDLLPDGRIRNLKVFNCEWQESSRHRALEVSRRNLILQRSHGLGHRYLIKVFASQISAYPQVIKSLSETYRVVSLERRNHFLQFISYHRACLSNDWHIWSDEDRGRYHDLPEAKVRIDQTEWNSWREKYLVSHQKLKARLNQEGLVTIYYEDIQDDLGEIIRRLALPEIDVGLSVSTIRNKGDDFSWLNNVDEVRSWFGPRGQALGLDCLGSGEEMQA